MTWVTCLVLFSVPLVAIGQPNRDRPAPRDYGSFGKPNQEEGRRFLNEARQRGIPGQHYAEFELVVLPRQGDEERRIPARLWSGHNARGPISRLVLFPGVKQAEHRLLIQFGPESAVWSWRPSDGKGVAQLAPQALFEPLAGTHFTPFDLQMQYLYWKDYVYEGTTRLQGRPTNIFLLYPTDEVRKHYPALTGVRAYLDTQFYAMVQAEMIGAGGQKLKHVALSKMVIIDGQGFPKRIDYRDEVTRNKTAFLLQGAAFRLNFSMTALEPANLAEPLDPPPADRIHRVGP